VTGVRVCFNTVGLLPWFLKGEVRPGRAPRPACGAGSLVPQHTGHGSDRLAVTAGQERNAFTGAVAVGVVPFVVAVFATRAGAIWNATLSRAWRFPGSTPRIPTESGSRRYHRQPIHGRTADGQSSPQDRPNEEQGTHQ
jgi:hypothetical protein